MITHRCKGSLDAGISIRWEKRLENLSLDNDWYAWRMSKYAYDFEYDVYVKHHFAEIKYCPFCGKLLEEIDDEAQI